MVAQALHKRRWVSDIEGALTVDVLMKNLQIWDMVDDISLHSDIPDHHQWQLTGLILILALIWRFFTGTIKFAPWRRLWKSWGPSAAIFVIWLAMKNRCWTTD
jgi:hypothetical protein